MTSNVYPETREGEGGDEILIDLINGSDEAALALLYERRGRLIYSLVYRMLGNAADSEEVTQDVFLRIWNNTGRFNRKQGSGLTWMVVMARHLAIDRMRSKMAATRKKELSIESTGVSETLEDGRNDPAMAAEESEAAAVVTRALQTLGEKYRQVVDLSYYEGLSHSGIATRIGVPLGTVKTRIRKAIQELRDSLCEKAEIE